MPKASPVVVPVAQTKKTTTPFREFQTYENGRLRRLKFDVNALADFEQETGMGFAQLLKQRAVFASARAMLWAGLKHEDRALQIEDVGRLLTDYLRDESVPQGTHAIDVILGVAIEAAVQQGALGRPQPPAPEEQDEESEPPMATTQSTGQTIDLLPAAPESTPTN